MCTHVMGMYETDGSSRTAEKLRGAISGHWFENGRITCVNVVG